MCRKSFLSLFSAGALMLTLAACGSAQEGEAGEYPPDDVTILVPYAAGGSTDTLARGLAEALGDHFDSTFVVENQPGAGGATAISSLLSAPSDGTTLAILASPTFLIPPASGQADYSLDDVRPVGLISEQPIVLLEVGSAPEGFIHDAATERKTIGTNGPDTAAGIDVQRLENEGGLNIQQIPFEGQAELITNLLGGNLDAIVVNATPDIIEGIEAGDYRAIATFSSERLDFLPDVPTFQEEGFEMASNATSQFGLFTSAEIDETVPQELNETLAEVLSQEDVREILGEDYISEEYVDGTAWLAQLESARDAYEEFFGSSQ